MAQVFKIFKSTVEGLIDSVNQEELKTALASVLQLNFKKEISAMRRYEQICDLLEQLQSKLIQNSKKKQQIKYLVQISRKLESSQKQLSKKYQKQLQQKESQKQEVSKLNHQLQQMQQYLRLIQSELQKQKNQHGKTNMELGWQITAKNRANLNYQRENIDLRDKFDKQQVENKNLQKQNEQLKHQKEQLAALREKQQQQAAELVQNEIKKRQSLQIINSYRSWFQNIQKQAKGRLEQPYIQKLRITVNQDNKTQYI